MITEFACQTSLEKNFALEEMRSCKRACIVKGLRQGDQLFPQFVRSLQLASFQIESSQSKERREELGRFPPLLTQLTCLGVSCSYLLSPVAFAYHQRNTQSKL